MSVNIYQNSALKTIAGSGGSSVAKSLTQAEYDALSDTEKNNGSLYIITDAEPSANIPASEVKIDTTSMSFTSDNLQGVMEEIVDTVPVLTDTIEETEAEERDADSLGGLYHASDITTINENLTNLQMQKLWENSSPTSTFASQTITLSSDDYDYLKIFFSYNNSASSSSNWVKSAECLKGHGTWLDFSVPSSSTSEMRHMTYSSDTTISAENGYLGTSVDNTRCIPLAVYGGKFA